MITVPKRPSAAVLALLLATSAPIRAQPAPSISQQSLKVATSDQLVRSVYQRLGWHAAWSDRNATALDKILAERVDHGLDHVRFLVDDSAGASPAGRDIARTTAALRYASALSRGIADPEKLHEVYTLPRPHPDLASGLASALQSGQIDKWFAGLAPQDDYYRRLQQSYLSERDKRSDNREAATGIEPGGGLIHVGDSDQRVPGIIRALADADYMSPQPGTKEGTYTQQIADAVMRVQTDYGIAADGVIGPETLSVLNLNAGDRTRMLAVALERQRWLARTPPSTRIDVNIAAARLQYFRDSQLVDERKVVVGEPDRPTPMLGSPIYRLVANPTWTIPKSIQAKMNTSGSYLRAHNMVWRGGYIVQRPGPKNALGLVKFDMKNDQAIYLHDTSAPSLFDKSERHLSHGCVRVDDAVGFADMLARDEGAGEQWQEAHVSGEYQTIVLPRQIPVRLLYENVFVAPGGNVVFRTDPYGWNDMVAQQLGQGSGNSRKADAKPIDLGP